VPAGVFGMYVFGEETSGVVPRRYQDQCNRIWHFGHYRKM